VVKLTIYTWYYSDHQEALDFFVGRLRRHVVSKLANRGFDDNHLSVLFDTEEEAVDAAELFLSNHDVDLYSDAGLVFEDVDR
jgi:hypothetical protein